MNTAPRLETTTNYGRFTSNKGQRSIDAGHVTKLIADMKAKGFNPSKPLTVVKEGKQLALIDGHHRLEAAKKAKVPVFFVTVSSNGIIPLNLLQRGWRGQDYLMHYVRKGEPEYIKLYNLIKEFNLGLALTTALAGATNSANKGATTTQSFRNGTYIVEDAAAVELASRFAKEVSSINKKLANRSLLSAFAKCSKVKGFDMERMLSAAKVTGKTKLSLHNTISGYIDELQSVYNYNRTHTIPLAFLANKKTR